MQPQGPTVCIVPHRVAQHSPLRDDGDANRSSCDSLEEVRPMSMQRDTARHSSMHSVAFSQVSYQSGPGSPTNPNTPQRCVTFVNPVRPLMPKIVTRTLASQENLW